jgi:type III secretion protein V
MSSRGNIRTERAQTPYADVALALLLLLIVALMIIPIPTPLLDVLIAGNIAIAVVMLLVSMAIPDGLAFAAMPTVLLVTTLYRLALNVSSTRLILLQADAGRVIRAFGDYVVRGNYAVGAVVFFILTLIQYVVVARGSERVAEVSARFTLDAMPGKQMAIDSDLRAGALSPDAARARRRLLERESQFYGAMDGAMKFVKGDAIAGIVITIVNIVAGVAIGTGMRDMHPVESLQLYGLLTIGDGLVCQIPSLLISTAAGLVVTRVAAEHEGASLARDLGGQLLGDPRVLGMAAGFLVLLALVPGLPALPFALLGVTLGATGYGMHRIRPATRTSLGRDGAQALAKIDLGLGPQLASELQQNEGAALEAVLLQIRSRFAEALGFELPALRAHARDDLTGRAYRVALSDVVLAHSEAASVQQLAEQLGTLLVRHGAELIDMQQTQSLLDALEHSAPALVRNSVPKPVSLRLLCEVLRRLVAEGVSIRPLARILETVANETASADAAAMIERVRVQLRRHVCFAYAREGVLALHPVDVMIEDALRDALAPSGLGLPPAQARDIVNAVRAAMGPVQRAVLIVQPDVRRALRALIETELPDVAVLSYAELASELRVERLAPVRIGGKP